MIFLCWNQLVSLTYSLTIVLSDVLHSHNASLFICLELIYSQRQQCFWLSHLFWSCLEMFPLWLMCCFSLRSFNLYNYGGSWYLAEIQTLSWETRWIFNSINNSKNCYCRSFKKMSIITSLFSRTLNCLHPWRWCLNRLNQQYLKWNC